MDDISDDVIIQPIPVVESKFKISYKSIFDINIEKNYESSYTGAYVNTINCQGVMGAGIALEFRKRYPEMFEDYKKQCLEHKIRPGDCYIFEEMANNRISPVPIYLLGLAVKNDWQHWSTLEWITSSLKSLKLAVLENDIDTVVMPLPGGKNGRRGPFGKVVGFTPPPERDEIKIIVANELTPFANKFGVDITLCLPDEAPRKPQMTLDSFV